MTKNITFTADDALIEEAREAARADNTTLNEQFRLWLAHSARKRRAERAMETVHRVCVAHRPASAASHATR